MLVQIVQGEFIIKYYLDSFLFLSSSFSPPLSPLFSLSLLLQVSHFHSASDFEALHKQLNQKIFKKRALGRIPLCLSSDIQIGVRFTLSFLSLFFRSFRSSFLFFFFFSSLLCLSSLFSSFFFFLLSSLSSLFFL